MDTSLLIPTLATATGLVGLGGGLYGRRRQRRSAHLRELAARQSSSARLRTAQAIWRRTEGQGQIALAAVGSYAHGVVPRILHAFDDAGVLDYVGPGFFVEFDESSRGTCMAELPPSYRRRAIQARSELWPIGHSNAGVTSVYANRELWEHDVQADAWLAELQREAKPGLLLAFVSSGGMASVGRPVLEAFHDRYPRSPIYLCVILDDKPLIRQRFGDLRALYSHDGLVRGLIVTDNLRGSRRNDAGLATLLSGLVGATAIGDRPTNLWNALGLLFPEDTPGQVATIRSWAEPLTVDCVPAADGLPATYFARRDQLIEKVLRGVKALEERPDLQALALAPARRGHTRLCVISAPLEPPDVQRLGHEVDQRLAAWRARSAPDLSVQYASTGVRLTPETREVPLHIVSMVRLAGPPEQVDDLARGQREVDPAFRPPASGPLAVLGHAHANNGNAGHDAVP